MNNLTFTYDSEGKVAQAKALNGQILEIQRRVPGPKHPNTLGTLINLGNNYFNLEDYAHAEALQSQGLKDERGLLGSEDTNTLIAMHSLAKTYSLQGKYKQAGQWMFATAIPPDGMTGCASPSAHTLQA